MEQTELAWLSHSEEGSGASKVPMTTTGLGQMLAFLKELRGLGLPYRITQSRESCVTKYVEVYPLRERWEVDFFEDGSVEADKFVPAGEPFEVVELSACSDSSKDIRVGNRDGFNLGAVVKLQTAKLRSFGVWRRLCASIEELPRPVDRS